MRSGLFLFSFRLLAWPSSVLAPFLGGLSPQGGHWQLPAHNLNRKESRKNLSFPVVLMWAPGLNRIAHSWTIRSGGDAMEYPNWPAWDMSSNRRERKWDVSCTQTTWAESGASRRDTYLRGTQMLLAGEWVDALCNQRCLLPRGKQELVLKYMEG